MMNVTTLDHFVTTHVRSPITLVKIDAEGFDGMILMSAKETLSQRKAAVVTTPEVMYVPQQFSTDNQFCKQD
ncbi:hypothetical protein Ctob_003305 [Chrysochromulina tobinii]|uniref:Methyltransferase FkbM domain-containing protein n=1 Tax=Chrysochromulina tobinii TaxID=1460289 RepID=A0A0M0JHS3_9EUKA|nr:hypothetical protein Ctob_003305 [Chrysochromulina tobinii]|eukprot:KOO26005.1 hypothetical protein Ctob_003305 [Chrysochromulina sp. CCMP291]